MNTTPTAAPGVAVEVQARAQNVASQCRATATDPLTLNVIVDGGSGTLRELLTDAAEVIGSLRTALLASAAGMQPEPVAYRFPKAGINNGYSYSDNLDGEEERFKDHWQALYARPPVPVRAPQEDNPTNLPASLGATVRDALVAGLLLHGYRIDGDDLALARRMHFLSMENRDLINMQKAVNSKLKARLSPTPAGAPQEVTDAEIDRFLGIYNNTVETTPQQRYQMRKALGDFTSRLVTGALPAISDLDCGTLRLVLSKCGPAGPGSLPVADMERVDDLLQKLTGLAATPPSAAPAEVLAHTGDNDVSTATLLDESATMLEDYALHQRDLGNDSTAAGADAHAYRLRHLNVAPPAEPKGSRELWDLLHEWHDAVDPARIDALEREINRLAAPPAGVAPAEPTGHLPRLDWVIKVLNEIKTLDRDDPLGDLWTQVPIAISALKIVAADPAGEAQGDAARLDWLSTEAGTVRRDTMGGLVPSYINWGQGVTLRQAIDAAMEAEKS